MIDKKILVFGSSGFLGNHLVESLYKENKIIQFDINPPKENMKEQPLFKGLY